MSPKQAEASSKPLPVLHGGCFCSLQCLLVLWSGLALSTVCSTGVGQREVRWYTSAGSRGQIEAEKAHATGFFSCCTGFAIYPNASFKCPDDRFWQVTTKPYLLQ